MLDQPMPAGHTTALSFDSGQLFLTYSSRPGDVDLNGTSDAKGLPLTWSTTENVVWRTKLPSWAAATPIIWGDTVFVTSAEAGFSPNKADMRQLSF